MIRDLPVTILSRDLHTRRKIEPRGKLKLESRNDSSEFSLPLRERKQHRSLHEWKRAWKASTIHRPSIQDENRFIVGQFQTCNYP